MCAKRKCKIKARGKFILLYKSCNITTGLRDDHRVVRLVNGCQLKRDSCVLLIYMTCTCS